MGACTSCCTQRSEEADDKRLLSSAYTPPSIQQATLGSGPQAEGFDDDPSRVSLPVAPSQIVRTLSFQRDEVHNAWAHTTKHGFMVKQGHKFRNWKRRYFILGNGMLRYYEAAGPLVNGQPTGQKEKGFVPLAGATVTKKISDLGRCKLTLTAADKEKNQILECDTPLELDEWFDAISQEILAANVDSLRKGERIEEVTQWYARQHQRNCDAMGLIRFGLLALVHVLDTSGFDHLISCWIQAHKDDIGIVVSISKDKPIGGDSTLTPVQKEIDGTTILFKQVLYAQMGPTKDVRVSNRLGPQACIFSIVTKTDAFDIEIDSPARAEEWVQAINSAARFSWIPVPGVRRGVVPNL